MNIMSELALILAVCLAGEGIAAILPVSFPASVISMVLLTVLLLTGVIKQRQIQAVSTFFIVNMGLFFVPALVGTLQYAQLLKELLVPFLLVTLLSTPVVYLVTAWTVRLLIGKRAKAKEGNGDA